MSGALQAVFQNQRSFGTPPGQQAYTSAGTYSWVAPAGVTSVSVVCVAAGDPTEQNSNRRGSGNAGCLSYKNNITVVPANSYTVYLANGTYDQSTLSETYFISTATVQAKRRTTRVGDGGGNGGNASDGGGGAGGYSGNGGNGSVAGLGGGGGGGGYVLSDSNTIVNGGGGGGVGILGEDSSGGAGGGNSAINRGGGGSNGANGTNASAGVYGNGGLYGGGAGKTYDGNTGTTKFGEPGTGACRIIWPGDARLFPSTRTANE